MIKDTDLSIIKSFINDAIDEKRVKEITYSVEHRANTCNDWHNELIQNPVYGIIELIVGEQTFKLKILLK